MPQVQLPIFPEGVTPINNQIAFGRRDGRVHYFNGYMPVFSHAEDDLATFRFFTSQLALDGTASQAEISRAFGVPLVTVKRYVKRLRQQGAKAFFAPVTKRSGPKLTPEALTLAQSLLNEGRSVPEIGRELKVLPNTIHKAISDGRLVRCESKKKK